MCFDSERYSRNLKGGIGSLFDPCYCYGATAILPVTYGGELWYLRLWRYHSARSAHIIVSTWFTAWEPICVCDLSPRGKGNSRLTKLFCRLSCEKIRRYNNSPPYVTARWPPQQIPPLNFLGGTVTCCNALWENLDVFAGTKCSQIIYCPSLDEQNVMRSSKMSVFIILLCMVSFVCYREPKCDAIKFSFLHFSIFMTIFQQNMMKNPHTQNLTWIGSWWPEIWPHEYLISPIEISVNWRGSKQLWTRPIYTDFSGAN